MPLYEYHCASCGQRLEVLQRFADAPLRDCPHCGGVLSKLLSAPALQFKGSGFYLTDYGRSGGRKAEGEGVSGEKAAASADAKPAADSRPASDSKPAAAPAKAAS